MRSTTPSAATVIVKLDDWGSGTQANITVKNNTTAAISSWSVTVPASNTINSSWDCDVASIDGSHTFENKSWNGSIPAGGSVTFGVIFAGSFKQPAADIVFFDARRVTVSSDTPAPQPDPQPDPTPPGPSPDPDPKPAPDPKPEPDPKPAPEPVPPAPAGDKMCMAYYIQWGSYGRKYFPSSIDAAKLTHVTYAFANISAAGEVISGDSYADWEMTQDNQKWDDPDKGNFGGLHRLRAAHPHLKLILSVGGWTWSDHFTVAAASADSRKRFAASAVDFLDKHGFDGLDLDWEYPQGGGQAAGRPEDRANLNLLLAECRAQLDALGTRKGQQYTLSMAVGMGPSIIPHYDAADLAKYCDWVGLMAYDYHGGFENKTGANAPLYAATGDTPGFNIDAGVKTWIAAGLPAAKMLMGVGFYGRGWSGVAHAGLGQPAAGPLSPGTWENGVFDFTDLQDNYIGKGDWTVTRDSDTKTPYLYSAAHQALITYDDEQSVNAKCDYLLEKGMKGTLIWELSGDRKNTLLSELAKRLLK